MVRIGFIGLGNMGGPMAANLVKAGYAVMGVDLLATNRDKAAAHGVIPAANLAEAVAEADVVVTMLPAGQQVLEVYTGAGGVLATVRPDCTLIDCSTIDVESARAVHAAAAERGLAMLDAPVSGGVGGAEAGTLTFMAGGDEDILNLMQPIFAAMGKAVIHAGGKGDGQAAKICNNLMLGIQMISVAEAFALADGLGLDRQKLFDVSSQASGQCWSLTAYCPVPGPVPASPANRGYKPGFAAAMMLKDLKLAQEAALRTGTTTPMGTQAAALYSLYCSQGSQDVDFSGIFQMIEAK